MTIKEYEEMIIDIIENKAEYEYRISDDVPTDVQRVWQDYNIAFGYSSKCEYRKKEKVWLEENYPCFDDEEGWNRSARNAIREFCKEFMCRFENKYVILCNDPILHRMKNIANEMGIEL